MSETGRDIGGEIRVAARHLADVSIAGGTSRIRDLGVEIGRLTAGDDPDTVDAGSPDFRAGAKLALEAVLNGFYEQGSIETRN